MNKSIALAVTNDLATDQRLHRIAYTLSEKGIQVTLIGRWHKKIPKTELPFRIVHLNPVFQKGFLFYALFNIRLFFYLLFHRFNAVTSNDLDTLTACFIACRIKCIPLIYDSHEYFTGLPELVGRPFVRNVWRLLERLFLPRIRFSSTVSSPIAELYFQQYGVHMEVIRNVPRYRPSISVEKFSSSRTIIYQGSINVGRGIENVIRALHFLPEVCFIIAGDGYQRRAIEQLVQDEGLARQVQFVGRLLPEELYHLTVKADVGVSLEERIGENYFYALPNKLFDYIQARIPVLVSAFPAMKEIIDTYGIGLTAESSNPEHLASLLRDMLYNETLRREWKTNLEWAAQELCWEKEREKLLLLYRQAKLI